MSERKKKDANRFHNRKNISFLGGFYGYESGIIIKLHHISRLSRVIEPKSATLLFSLSHYHI